MSLLRVLLGHRLREHRQKAGLYIEFAAQSLDWSSSKLARIEAGRVSVSVNDLRALLILFEVPPSETAELLDLARVTTSRVTQWTARAAAEAGRHVLSQISRMARTVLVYDELRLPPLLYTAAYAHAMRVTTSWLVHDNPMGLVEGTDPPHVVVALDRVVVEGLAGPDEHDVGQLHHLLALARRPNVDLRILDRPGGGTRRSAVVFRLRSLPIDAIVWHPYGAVTPDRDIERAVEADVAEAWPVSASLAWMLGLLSRVERGVSRGQSV